MPAAEPMISEVEWLRGGDVGKAGNWGGGSEEERRAEAVSMSGLDLERFTADPYMLTGCVLA